MARFIVVPKPHNGRGCSYEIIDTDAAVVAQVRLGIIDDKVAAESVAAVLNGAEKIYAAEINSRTRPEYFQ